MKKKSYFAGLFLVVLMAILIAAIYWMDCVFGEIPFAQLLFHMTVPLDGADSGLVEFYLESLAFVFVILMVVVNVPLLFDTKLYKKIRPNKSEWKIVKFLDRIRRFYVRHFFVGMLIGFLGVMGYSVYYFGIPKYIRDQMQTTTIYEDYYVDSKQAEITFPANKKNLILIVMESMEGTFADVEHGGAMRRNLIPNLTKLAEDNVHFSMENNLQGAVQVPGTSWTIAGILAQTSGTPMTLPIGQNGYGRYKQFMPGLTTLGDVLEQEGYVNEFMLGSEADFAGMDKYFEQHGDYKIFDYYTAIDREYIDEDYYEFWGVEDCKLLEYAKIELDELSQCGKPFQLVINTIDAHTPTGYTCENCGKKFLYKYENVIACQDKQIADFVEWLKQQSYYDNTVVVIVGDHLSMSKKVETYMERGVGKDGVDDYERTTYHAILNSSMPVSNATNRIFSTMDMYPTILASLGCEIKGNRLGFGTNLYSDTPTLMEEVGEQEFMDEISKNSKYYKNKIIKGN